MFLILEILLEFSRICMMTVCGKNKNTVTLKNSPIQTIQLILFITLLQKQKSSNQASRCQPLCCNAHTKQLFFSRHRTNQDYGGHGILINWGLGMSHPTPDFGLESSGGRTSTLAYSVISIIVCDTNRIHKYKNVLRFFSTLIRQRDRW